jgi:pimeloyl-ACP methyl ester carboxylesterase
MLKSDSVRLKSGRGWQVYGGGSGPALLWLHGPRGVDADDPLLEALGQRHRIVAPVAPGFNDLDELAEIDSVHELALDYDDLLRGMGLDTLGVVGHSFGGMVAAELAAHFPERAHHLVLLAPVGLWNDAYPVADVFGVPVGEMDRLLWHDEGAREAHAARIAASAAGQDQIEQLLALTRNLTSLTKILWPIPDRGLKRRLRRITAPTLILAGAEDRFVPARYAADFASSIAGAKSRVLAGAGHMVPYEKTADVVAAIQSFLAGAPA